MRLHTNPYASLFSLARVSRFEALLAQIHAPPRGAPGYPLLTMFKILLLQHWGTLSDPFITSPLNS
jgi:hypothetical protein